MGRSCKIDQPGEFLGAIFECKSYCMTPSGRGPDIVRSLETKH